MWKWLSISKILNILVITGIVIFILMLNDLRDDYTRNAAISEVLIKLSKLKIDYSEQILSGAIKPGSDSIGFKAFGLSNYGLNEMQQVDLEGDENSYAITFNRRIEVTPTQITIIFGPGIPGLDDDQENTLITEPKLVYNQTGTIEAIDWSCIKGTIPLKLRRPENKCPYYQHKLMWSNQG